ncbi:hypothetical protein NDU88_001705 [Pleurodeles waltl]|uniref:Uncharacterized protein n=1 Tax=Pleurodeles waltl TaxID=8319 RepID=A0AAV7MTH8_PLEWA|nr:hypothetical protein NDU88_001705 [Pleurodeles waltl]
MRLALRHTRLMGHADQTAAAQPGSQATRPTTAGSRNGNHHQTGNKGAARSVQAPHPKPETPTAGTSTGASSRIGPPLLPKTQPAPPMLPVENRHTPCHTTPRSATTRREPPGTSAGSVTVCQAGRHSVPASEAASQRLQQHLKG